jgi:hypothetical protein
VDRDGNQSRRALHPARERVRNAMRGWTHDRWIALAAVVAACAAVAGSCYDGCQNRDYMKRSKRPEIVISYYHNSRGSEFWIGNIGLGPARIQWFSVLVDGRHVFSWEEMVRALGFEDVKKAGGQYVNPASSYRPGPMRKMFWVEPGPLDDALRANRVEMRTCYCSWFDECWLESSRSKQAGPLDSCEPLPVRQFNDPAPTLR